MSLCAFLLLQLRLWCDCPFWREDGMCHSRDCSVGECTDEEVPGPLKIGHSPLPAGGTTGESDFNHDVSDVSTTFSALDLTVDRSAFRSWVEEDNPWTHDNEANSGRCSCPSLSSVFGRTSWLCSTGRVLVPLVTLLVHAGTKALSMAGDHHFVHSNLSAPFHCAASLLVDACR